jgi:hypothetical protein
MKNRRVIGCAIFAATLLAALAAPAQAYQHWPHNYHLTFGAQGQKYWIGELAETNEPAIDDAVSSWNSASGKVSYSQTGTQSQSRLDFTHPSGDNGACANTLFFVDTDNVGNANGAPTKNYWWAKVQVRDALNDTDACGPVNHRRGILAHEMGHALGLAHVTGGAARIMRTYIAYPANYGINVPQPDDIAGVNALY